jgi:type IV secretion system protein TrbF
MHAAIETGFTGAMRLPGAQGRRAGEARPPDNAPHVAFEQARLAWFEIYGLPVTERARYFALAMVFGVAFICSVVAITVLVPLKTVVPFVVERAENGAVTPMPAAAQKYVPGASERRYFIAQWVKKLLTLDRYFTEPYLSEAYLLTRAKATAEFTDWLQKHAPIAELQKDPSLTRTVSISSVSLLQEDVALVRLTTERRSMGNSSAMREKFVVTIHFALVPPKTEEDLFKNPIGLFITHFSINDDLEK